MEELSLRNNRGSLLFQKRQRRVQKFTFEFAASQRPVSSTVLTGQLGPRGGQWFASIQTVSQVRTSGPWGVPQAPSRRSQQTGTPPCCVTPGNCHLLRHLDPDTKHRVEQAGGAVERGGPGSYKQC